MENLENKVRTFDWKEWTPFLGLIVVPEHYFEGTASKSIDTQPKSKFSYLRPFLNGGYHGTYLSVLMYYFMK